MDTHKSIIHRAMENEEAAYKLYKKGEELADTQSARELFATLAAEELGHKKKLGQMDEGTASVGSYPHIAEKMTLTPLNELKTVQDILQRAIEREQQEFEVYEELKNNADEEDIRELFGTLAHEEREHKVKLQEEYEKVFN